MVGLGSDQGVTRIGSRDRAVEGCHQRLIEVGSAARRVWKRTQQGIENPHLYKSPCEQYRSEDCPSTKDQRLQAVSKPTPNFETVCLSGLRFRDQMSWQLQSLEALASTPAIDNAQAEERGLEVSEFLSNAPTDFLEPLIGSPFGRVYKLFLERCCTSKFTSTASEERRANLSQKLRQVGCETPEGWAILLSIFPYFPPGQLKVEDAAAKLPGWLYNVYEKRYETTESKNAKQHADGAPTFEDRIFLNRILGLSNLYYIDPEDKEILNELREVRLQTIKLMLSVGSEELGVHFRSDFGDRFWAMAQCGVQKEALDANEVHERNEIQDWLSQTPNSLHQDGGIQRFAAVLLFNPPGSVRLAEPERNLPTWFMEGYKRYCSMAQA